MPARSSVSGKADNWPKTGDGLQPVSPSTSYLLRFSTDNPLEHTCRSAMPVCPNCSRKFTLTNIMISTLLCGNCKFNLRCWQCKTEVRPKYWALYLFLEVGGWLAAGGLFYTCASSYGLPSAALFILWIALPCFFPLLLAFAEFRTIE
jgi:hypothetical protein